MLDALAANVVHDEPRLARRAAHVPGARADDQIALRPGRARAALAARGGLGGAAPAALLRLLLGLRRLLLRRLGDLLRVLRGSLLLRRRRGVAHGLPGV